MNLTDIKSPSDIKGLSEKELKQLAREIRDFLIDSISKTGGHLASNLGVVELTIALHYVFQSPTDKIFFDVGHQCYTHKILTGRAAQFPTLKQYHGLSGFEKRSESVHDVWEAGHSSTSLSAALGMAIARDLKQEEYQVIPVIGDGALSSGMALEALNQIGYEQRKVIIIFNDNNMSISKNVGAMTMEFGRLRSSKGYNHFKDNLKSNLKKNDFGNAIYSGLKSVKDNIRDSIVDRGVFGEFNLGYIGPIDGHNIHDLIQALEVAKTHDGPIVVHVITKKGKGYIPCEIDREGKWHGVGPFDRQTGKMKNEIPSGFVSWSALLSDHVSDLADKDSRIVALTPAMIQGSHMQKFFAKHPDRAFDCGIAEEHAATLSAGMAIDGLRPYIVFYSSFLQRAYDQINHDICRMDLPVVIGIDHAGLVGADGETHHGIFDIGILKPLPNLILAQPKNAAEAIGILDYAFQQKHPFAIRYPKGNVAYQPNEKVEISDISWEMLPTTEDDKVIVFTYGESVHTLAEKLRVNQIPATIVNCRFIKPMDEKMLQQIGEMHLPILTYETDMLEGGLGQDIIAWYQNHDYTLHIKQIGIRDQYVQQGAETRLRKELHIDLNTVLEEINTLL